MLRTLSLSLIFFTLVIYLKRAIFSSGVYGFTDFYTFYESVRFYFSGQNIYSNIILLKTHHDLTSTASGHSNLNPPFFVLLLLPLHYFNYAHALQVYSMISMVCMVLGGMLIFYEYPQCRKNILPLMALFLIYAPNSETLSFGQVTNILLVLLVGVWMLARRNQDGWAGILVGLACAIKLFCGLFLVYFLVLKRTRAVGSALAIIAITTLITGLVFGFSTYLSYHQTLGKIRWYVESWNDSFYGFFMRLFSNTEKNHALINIPQMVPYLTAIVSAVLVAALWKTWIKIKKTEKKEKTDFDVGFSLVIVAMLLLSPLGWGYYFPLLLIPYLILVERGSTWVHLMACFILFVSMQTGDLIRPPEMQTLSQILILSGLGFYVLLGMLLLLFYVSRQNNDSKGPVISESLWMLIYAVVFIPSFISLGCIVKGLYILHAL